MAITDIVPYTPRQYPNIEGNEKTYVAEEFRRIADAIKSLRTTITATAKKKLTEDTTFYVRPGGNDTTGDGTVDDDDHAFATPHGAYQYLLDNIDACGHFIKVRMSAGTYTASDHRRTTDEFSVDTTVLTINAPVMNCPCVEFEGSTPFGSYPHDVTWDANGNMCVFASAVGGIWRFNAINFVDSALSADSICFFSNSSHTISWGNVDFGEFGRYHMHMGGGGAQLKCFGDYTISGGTDACHVWMEGESDCDFEDGECTITNTPNFGGAFFQIDRDSMLFLYGMTWTGAATGIKYKINDFGSIAHGGDHDDLDDIFPGDQNGIVIHRFGGHNPTQVLDADGSGDTVIPQANISGRDNTAALVVSRFSNDAYGGQLVFLKSRSTSRIGSGAGTVPSNGDELGRVSWQMKDSTQASHAAGVRALCIGTASHNDSPSALELGATPDGSGGTDTTWWWRLDGTDNGALFPLTDGVSKLGKASNALKSITLSDDSFIQLGGTAYADLPTPVSGMIVRVTDSNTATWGATVAGGGANNILAWYNGANWTVFGA
jgi:hypothetical protein